MQLISAVCSAFWPSRSRCKLSWPCCSAVSIGTRRMCGLPATSHIAAASLASFLPPLPAMRYGVTKWPAINRASRPSSLCRRVTWCALLHAAIATRQPAGNSAHQAKMRRRRPAQHLVSRPVHRVHLEHTLGQIHRYPSGHAACNLRHDYPLPIRSSVRKSFLVARYRCWIGEVPLHSLNLTLRGRPVGSNGRLHEDSHHRRRRKDWPRDVHPACRRTRSRWP